MKRSWMHGVMGMTLAGGMILAMAIGTGRAADGDFTDKRSKISYCVGLDIGRSFSQGEWDLDMEQLIEGIRHAYKKEPWKVENDEMMRVISEYRQELQEKQKQKHEQAAESNRTEGKKFLDENAAKKAVTVLPSGLQYEVIKTGQGPSPKATDKVKVHYRGTLIDGTEFDSSHKNGQPVEFGVGQVIAGWSEALQLMQPGAVWRVVIPPELGYGQRGAGQVIGPNAVLIFEIELLDILNP
ncbi:FKBP-type peptidyl-prolyl cis-trans isomerase [bacterium]|nr:FKBP-type peptidyl-prolyl cis-trans isomerase [candidate division CSSED10-310 bacterium]